MSPSDPEVVRVDVTLLEAPLQVDVVTSQGIPGPPGPPGVDGVDGVDGAPGPPGPSGAVAHAPTHNTGGADPITALSAAVLTTGTLPNARLAAAVTVTTSVSVGTNPAQSGAVRLPNNQAIKARDAANSADITLLNVAADNQVQMAGGAAGVTIYPGLYVGGDLYGAVAIRTPANVQVGTNPAQSGAVRLANQQAIMSRDAANTGDLPLLSWDNAVLVGPDSGVNYTRIRNILHVPRNAQIDGQLLINGYATLPERGVAPAAPAANTANLWLQDNGAGKTQLMIQFATGVPIQIATQV